MFNTKTKEITGDLTLVLTIIEAKLIRDTETFGKMDPFTLIQHRGTKYRTDVH